VSSVRETEHTVDPFRESTDLVERSPVVDYNKCLFVFEVLFLLIFESNKCILLNFH
jgi:hypothetical protein